MFLHETTFLLYPASVTYDGTPLSWQSDIGLAIAKAQRRARL